MSAHLRTGRVVACLSLTSSFALALASPPLLAATPSGATAASRGAADCLITVNGDMNNSGTVSSADIIKVLNFCFNGAPPPTPCLAAGDVNCDGVVTAGDVIVMVNIVFKSTQTPCDICANSPLAATCN